MASMQGAPSCQFCVTHFRECLQTSHEWGSSLVSGFPCVANCDNHWNAKLENHDMFVCFVCSHLLSSLSYFIACHFDEDGMSVTPGLWSRSTSGSRSCSARGSAPYRIFPHRCTSGTHSPRLRHVYFSRSKYQCALNVYRFWTVTLEVDVTFRVILDWEDACERYCLTDLDNRSPDVFSLSTKKSLDMDWWGRVAVVQSSCIYDPIYLVLS
jgi:hypothetical protein